MTKHEADVIGGLNMTDQISNEAYKQIMIAAQDENEVDDVLDKIRAEIEEIQLIGYATVDGKREIASRAVLQIIDKYRTGSNETQTNEIVYDVGGHMYGAMGGDVIMDILAGKER